MFSNLRTVDKLNVGVSDEIRERTDTTMVTGLPSVYVNVNDYGLWTLSEVAEGRLIS